MKYRKQLLYNKKYQEKLKKLMWGTKLWEQGYFVRSVGDETTSQAIMRYIEKQGKQRNVKTEQLKFFS